MMLWDDYEDSNDEVSKCGIVETPLIIGGETATMNEFPHMVRTISSNRILTTWSKLPVII